MYQNIIYLLELFYVHLSGTIFIVSLIVIAVEEPEIFHYEISSASFIKVTVGLRL